MSIGCRVAFGGEWKCAPFTHGYADDAVVVIYEVCVRMGEID